MQVPPRTPKDRAAVAQRTQHPANPALNEEQLQHPRTEEYDKQDVRDRTDSGDSAGFTG